jgi:phage tail sheath gpL-like
MGFFDDLDDADVLPTAEEQMVAAIRRVQVAVDGMSRAVHRLEVKGGVAERWMAAVTTFDTTSQECRRNCDRLAAALAARGDVPVTPPAEYRPDRSSRSARSSSVR